MEIKFKKLIYYCQINNEGVSINNKWKKKDEKLEF